MCDQQSLRSACAFAQSDQSICLLLEYSMIVKLLTERHSECLSLEGGCRGSSESTHVEMPHCWKSHVWLNASYLVISQVKRFIKSPSSSSIWYDRDRHVRSTHNNPEKIKNTCETIIWTSGVFVFLKTRDSNQSPQLQRLARTIKL